MAIEARFGVTGLVTAGRNLAWPGAPLVGPVA